MLFRSQSGDVITTPFEFRDGCLQVPTEPGLGVDRGHRCTRPFRRIGRWGGPRGVASLRDFDDKITAYYSGFEGAVDYYARAAAANVVDHIAAPGFILHAANDPFIRILPETRRKILANPNLAFVETDDGGHCSFIADPGGDDGHWAERQVVTFLRAF